MARCSESKQPHAGFSISILGIYTLRVYGMQIKTLHLLHIFQPPFVTIAQRVIWFECCCCSCCNALRAMNLPTMCSDKFSLEIQINTHTHTANLATALAAITCEQAARKIKGLLHTWLHAWTYTSPEL